MRRLWSRAVAMVAGATLKAGRFPWTWGNLGRRCRQREPIAPLRQEIAVQSSRGPARMGLLGLLTN